MAAPEEIENASRAPCVAISHGNVAFFVGKGRLASNPDHTHKWTVFVRGAYGQDISYAVEKVVFSLHPSFVDHIRVISEPPFQVSETGWGAFEIGIDIHLRDPAARAPVHRVHLLRLYPDPLAGGSGAPVGGSDKPVVSEAYDEIVFSMLPEDAAFRAALLRGPVRDAPPYPYGEYLAVFTPEPDLAQIALARKYVADRVEELEERLVKAQAARAALQHRHLPDLGLA